MNRILIASQNQHKIDEIAPVLESAGFDVTDARLYNLPEPVEDSGTFFGNARIKAVACCDATGLATLADDSGLIVPALGEFPGVDTAPYAKECGGYDAAVRDIFKRLDGRPADCYYIAVLIVRFPDGTEIGATGRVEGRLIEKPRGDGRFGFDPWFEIKNNSKTFAELNRDEKNRLSHRGRALHNLLENLSERHALRPVC